MSDSESEVDSIELLMESFVNLEKKFELLAEHSLLQTELLVKLVKLFEPAEDSD